MTDPIVSFHNYGIVKFSSPCTYCKSPFNSKWQFQLYAEKMTPEQFNELNDRGWIRFARILSKFMQDLTCCPTYGISHLPPLAVNGQQTSPERAQSSPSIAPNVDLAKVQVRQKGKKLKQFRKDRKLNKLAQKGVDINKYQEERKKKEEKREKKVEYRLKQCVEFQEGVNKHKLETRLVAINSLEFYERVIESFIVYKKYQEKFHNLIHGIDEFLDYAETPFENLDQDSGKIYGTYHLQYLLDGRIIGVGVIDILPRCLLSQYFYYDPDYAFLNLGTFSVLNEIVLTKQLSTAHPKLIYHSMSLFVQTTKKLSYKANFKPSEILCENCMQWIPKLLLPKIRAQPYESRHTLIVCESCMKAEQNDDIEQLPCLYNGAKVLYGSIRSTIPEFYDHRVKLYAKYMGPLAFQMLLQF